VANYPAFFTLADSTAAAADGLEPERATNGALKLRRLWSADKVAFEIGHVLSAAQKATLDAFYAANKDLDVTYTWPRPATAYTVRFVAPPRYTPRGEHFEARVRLLEV
jgi:ABC-type branched-subunit amino acid transport system substrate-binding protein